MYSNACSLGVLPHSHLDCHSLLEGVHFFHEDAPACIQPGQQRLLLHLAQLQGTAVVNALCHKRTSCQAGSVIINVLMLQGVKYEVGVGEVEKLDSLSLGPMLSSYQQQKSWYQAMYPNKALEGTLRRKTLTSPPTANDIAGMEAHRLQQRG